MKTVERVVVRSGIPFKTTIAVFAVVAFLVLFSAIMANAQAPACGSSLNDTAIHIPTNYSCSSPPCTSNPFPPPAKGSGYQDPQYGCTITRLTDAHGDGLGVAAHHQYSTINPVNADDTLVMVLLEDGSKEVVDPSGNVIVPIVQMPDTNSGNVPWDLSVPTRFYYTAGTKILRGDISGLPGCASTHNCAVTPTVLKDFTPTYAEVQIPDQEDISNDGDHLWLVGDTKAFLYTISTGTAGTTLAVGVKENASGWHKIQIMPSNRMLMTWESGGHATGSGQEVYNTNATLNWHMLDNTIHTDCGLDLSSNEVCVVARVPDTGGGITGACPTWDGSQDGGADVINMSTHAAQCLVDVHWLNTEVSFRDSSGWVLLSAFDQSSTSPCTANDDYSCFDTTSPSHLATNWQSVWGIYFEELLLAKIDGSSVYRLAHHRSRSAEYYWAIPRAAISRDAKHVVFDSNFDISNSGLTDYTDVYLAQTPTQGGGQAGFTLVQSSAPGYVSAASQNVSLNGVGAGHLLIVCAYDNVGAGITMSVSDSLGSSWSATSAITNTQGSGGPISMRIFYAVAPTGGNDTITLTQSSGTAALGGLYFEYSGNSSSNVLDATAGHAAPSSTSNASSPNVTTTGPHDLLVGFFGDTSGSGTITAGSGYTMRLTDTNFYAGTEDRTNVAAGTYNATATMPSTDAGWIAVIASFK